MTVTRVRRAQPAGWFVPLFTYWYRRYPCVAWYALAWSLALLALWLAF